MKIVCVEPLGMSKSFFEEKKQEYKEKGVAFEYYMDRDERVDVMAMRMYEADIVIVSNIPLPAQLLSRCPQLKMLSVAFTGLDHIDLAYCEAHQIKVRNAAGYSTTAVSELAVGLMIDLLRDTHRCDRMTRAGEGRGTLIGSELRGRTVGVVGTGAIGIATIRLLQAFGCRIVAYSRTEKESVKEIGVTYMGLEDLMRVSDIVTLHVPLNEGTRHLINAHLIGLMKPTALLVNTARGGVVDTQALAGALRRETIRGAAVDVYETEPPLDVNHPLLQAPNCICLPHIGYATREAFDIRADIVFKELV